MQDRQRDPGESSATAAAGPLRYRRLEGRDLLWVDGIEPAVEWFDPDWLARHDHLRGTATGRGTTHFACVDGRELVLRHYRRGGMLRDLLGDRYLWTGLRHSRPWRELAVQARLHALGLPVPAPVGGLLHYASRVSPFYRADLLTERIPCAHTLAECATRSPLGRAIWREVGVAIARFHAAGLEHADLNAHNILIDNRGRIRLIDFDRARLHAGPGKWTAIALVRLRRSLDKLSAERDTFAFEDDDWDVLTAGYEAERRSGAASAKTSRMASR